MTDNQKQDGAAARLSLRAVDSATFRTSKAADELNEKMRSNLGLQHRYEPARLAIARSLAIKTPPPPLPESAASEGGKSIYGRNLFGEDDLPAWLTLIVQNSSGRVTSVDSLLEEVRRHWHRGMVVLTEEWHNCSENYEAFMLSLVEKTGIERQKSHSAEEDRRGANESLPSADWPASSHLGPLKLQLGEPGTDLKTGDTLTWHLNGRGSPHVALMGGTGTGKTRLARSLLTQAQSQGSTPTLIFDFKGDLSEDQNLLKALKATVIEVSKRSVPLDVLYTPSLDPAELSNAAMRFRESFTKIPNGNVGAVQQDLLRDAARSALRKRRDGNPVSIRDVRDELQAQYAQASRKGDIVTSTFNDLTQDGIDLFSPTMTPLEFFSQSWIVDVHAAQETAQRLIVFLILDALYALFKELRDSAMDSDGNRAIRMFLVVDEAKRVLGYGQPSLMHLVRESRSKGMSVFLISQSPDDYDTVEENFLEQIGLTVCFRSNGSSPRVLKECLGQPVDLAGLPDGVAVTRLPGKSLPARFQAWV
jgi:hypothetical protein